MIETSSHFLGVKPEDFWKISVYFNEVWGCQEISKASFLDSKGRSWSNQFRILDVIHS